MEVERMYLEASTARLLYDCPASGTRFQHWAQQRRMPQQHLDGLDRRFIEIGSVARVVHRPYWPAIAGLMANCPPGF
jgi:hypothetical protein